MEITRNQYFCIGLVLLFLGLHFRAVDTVVLTPTLTQALARRSTNPVAAVSATAQSILPFAQPVARKTVRPPDWIGWALLSFGGVFTLHALSIKKQG